MHKKLKLVWFDGGLFERRWTEFLLSDVISEIHEVEMTPPEAESHTVYVFPGPNVSLDGVSASFLDSAQRLGTVGLIDLADEWFRHDHNRYRHFAFVLRNFHASPLNRRGILTVPLGFPRFAATNKTPASKREFEWVFAGQVVASRFEMLRALRDIGPHRILAREQDRITRPEYMGLIAQTKFLPAPMGNVILETWRFYEGLEAGCIPILEKRLTMDYYRQLLGEHPIPTFQSWWTAARFMAKTLDDPGKMDRLQSEILHWWSDAKAEWRSRVGDFIQAGMEGRWRKELQAMSFATGLSRRAWRYSELLRHHSGSAAVRRLVSTLHRTTSRRISQRLPKN